MSPVSPVPSSSCAPLPVLLLLLLLGALPGCGDQTAAPEPATLGREAFLSTYVELRAEAVAAGDTLTDSLRAAVLERQGVTEEELLEFAETRGEDIGFMRDLWAEVEARLQDRRIPAHNRR